MKTSVNHHKIKYLSTEKNAWHIFHTSTHDSETEKRREKQVGLNISGQHPHKLVFALNSEFIRYLFIFMI